MTSWRRRPGWQCRVTRWCWPRRRSRSTCSATIRRAAMPSPPRSGARRRVNPRRPGGCQLLTEKRVDDDRPAYSGTVIRGSLVRHAPDVPVAAAVRTDTGAMDLDTSAEGLIPGRPARAGGRVRVGVRLLDRPLTSYYLVLGITVLLLALGLVMVLSTSSAWSLAQGGSPYAGFQKQLLGAVVGLPLMWVAAKS